MAAHPGQLGLQSTRSVDRSNVARLQQVWSRPLGPGCPGRHAARSRRRPVPANTGDNIQAMTRKTANCSGTTSAMARRPAWRFHAAINRNIAIYGTAIIDTSADDYVFALDALRANCLGNANRRFPEERRSMESSARSSRTARSFPDVSVSRGATTRAASSPLTTRRPGKNSGGTSTIPKPGEPGDETWGDIPSRNAGTSAPGWCPATIPELNLIYVGTSVTIPAPNSSCRATTTAPLSQLHARPERRHRQDRVVLPAHCRSLGSRSSVERLLVDTVVAAAARRVAGSIRRSTGERRKVITGIPGKPASCIRSIARPASFCGPRRRSARTSSATSTAPAP